MRASSTATLSGMKSAAGEAYIMASCSLGMAAALTQHVGSTACAESVTLVVCYSLEKQMYVHQTTKPVRILSFFMIYVRSLLYWKCLRMWSDIEDVEL